MVESIQELRKICQESKGDEPWFRFIYRRISIYFTKIVLYTPLSANQVTMLRLFLGVLGCFLLIFGRYSYNIIGGLLLHLSVIFDFVDGEVARYRGTASRAGIFLEKIAHRVVEGLMFPAVTFGVFNNLRDPRVFILGFSATLSLMVFFQLRDHIKFIRSQETHQTHKSVEMTIQMATRNPASFLILVGTSFYLRYYLILIGAVVNSMDVYLFGYGVILPMACSLFLLENFRTEKRV